MEATNASRWSSSGRSRPCELCGRNTDGKCRRGPGWISCWHGSTFHPPDLKVGEVVTIEGEPWAVVSVRGGFGGNSTVLRPHQERQHLPRAARRKLERSEAEIVAGKLRLLTPLIAEALAVEPFEHLRDDQFREVHQLIQLAVEETTKLLPRLAAIAGSDVALRRLLVLLGLQLRELRFQAEDADRWASSWEYRLAVYQSGSPALPEEAPEPPPLDLGQYQPRDLIVLALQGLHREQGARP